METSKNRHGNGASNNVVSLPVAQNSPVWNADVAWHGVLTDQCKGLSKLRRQVANALGSLDRSASPADQATQGLSALPAGLRMRMAVRVGLAKVKRADRKAPTPFELLQEELGSLTNMVSQRRARIAEMENRLLRVRPQNASEARALMSFVSRLLASGQTFERRLLTELMDACALQLNTPANDPSVNTASG